MKRGLTLPIFGELADPALLARLAAEAEDAGFDGVFLWDHLDYRPPVERVTDCWISLAAVACATSRILLGPMVTPLARRRPAVVARQITALDHLSRGRMVLGVGLGLDSSGGEFGPYGETTDVSVRASMYDEALTALTTLLTGEPGNFAGAHYRLPHDVQFLPRPVQATLPIWVAARWPNRKPVERAARHDGVFVIDLDPENVADVVEHVVAVRRNLDNFDVVVHAPASSPPERWEAAGATWCLTAFDPFTVTARDVQVAIADLRR